MAKSTYYYLKAIALAIVYFISLYGAQAQVHLVKDLSTLPQSSSAWDSHMKQVGNVFYFTAHTNLYGRELWMSDGTDKGTVMVKDILTGSRDGEVQYLTALNGVLYFVAKDDEHGNELWRSDGTENGTYVVKDFHEGQEGTNFARLAVAGGYLYINILDGSKYELWKTNGVETTKIKEFVFIGDLTSAGNAVYFSAEYGNGEAELWRSEGTPETTAMVKDISGPGVTSGANYITNINGTIYFVGYTSANGSELWKTDGTAAGTVMVKDIAAGNGNSVPQKLTASGSKLYFTALGTELWYTDGTTTALVRDFNNGGSGSFGGFLGVNGSLYFVAHDSRGAELWRSDGTTAGTDIIADIAPGSNGSNPSSLTLVNGSIFFTANDLQNGRELWKTDGTPGGTAMVKNIRETVDEMTPTALIALGQNLYFWADDGIHGNELWVSRSNGQTELVKDIATGTESANFELLMAGNSDAWFTEYNTGVWKTDGTDAGTTLVFDGIDMEYKQLLKTKKGMYAAAHNNGDNSEVLLLFDGVSPMPIELGIDFVSIRNLIEIDGVLYFVGEAEGKGAELWKSNGNANDATMVMDINPGAGSSSPNTLYNYNGVLYFKANNGVNGSELWKCEGSTALGTRMVKDIWPGNSSSNIQEIVATETNLFFSAGDLQHGFELWTTDGTDEGTHVVADIWPGQGSGSPYEIVTRNNKVYFFATDPGRGFELWTSDGTEEGTKLVKDIYPGDNYMDYMPDNLIVVNGSLYMAASDGEHGVELWRSDGTTEGTFMVRDITTGSKGSQLSLFPGQNDHLFFVANGELWRSNGTECSTLPVLNGTDVSFMDLSAPVTVDNKLFFYGLSSEFGGELYYYDFSTVNDPGCTQTVAFEAIPTKTIGDASFELQATSSAGLPIIFSVASDDVISIDGNTVTIHAAGQVRITASQAGDINYSSAFAEQTLIVNKKQQTITFGELPEKIAGEAPFTIAATASSGLTVVYTSSNNNVATIDGSTVTITGPGEVSIAATQDGNNEYDAASAVTQTLIVKLVTGLEEDVENLVSVFPNPTSDYVFVDGSAVREGAMLSLLDINGRVIDSTLSGEQYSFDVRNLSRGIYFVRITTGKFSVTKRIVIK